MNASALIIMAKEPKIGSTKTRLCPPLKPEEAAALYEALLWDTVDLVAGIAGIDLAIAITPPGSIAYFERTAPPETILVPVSCADIGECLTYALGKLIDMGYESVMALNSDGPTLPPEYIQTASKLVHQHDLLLGPAEDGGYYLIGFQRLYTQIFDGIDWSTDQVLVQTLHKAKQIGLDVGILPAWFDVDTAADIRRLQEDLQSLPPNTLTHTRQFLDRWSENA